ncbi:MAG: tRNA (adenosine(37)-N6)-dimethylallyltransferase MiaA [Tannerella sp.]|jgi:tRNA dimethylallyltransferase|nr:tRNA (adenosine(37)-N6)-dimethylallyltransferase MiaA [Tannerella sp.]
MNTLLVLLGPTGVGKTALSIQIAEKINSPIISADSRQIYRELVIGTAAPSAEQLKQVRHYMIGALSLADYYSASRYEEEVIALLDHLYKTHPAVLLTGGSMMYIDAVCKGIDEMPAVAPDIRAALWKQYEAEGLQPILAELKEKDPVHYERVDRNNYKRVIHAVEMCRMMNRPYSSLRTQTPKKRPFRTLKIGLTRPREELCERINRRVDEMIAAGLINEARSIYNCRRLNSLNTVGYKELFNYFDRQWTLEQAVEKIKRNSRVYARKQMTWFKRDNEIHWFHPDEKDAILHFIENSINE